MFKKINFKRVAIDVAGAVAGATVMGGLSVGLDKALGKDETDKESLAYNAVFGATIGAWAADTFAPHDAVDSKEEIIDAEVITEETK